jgi:hypothetical protein
MSPTAFVDAEKEYRNLNQDLALAAGELVLCIEVPRVERGAPASMAIAEHIVMARQRSQPNSAADLEIFKVILLRRRSVRSTLT